MAKPNPSKRSEPSDGPGDASRPRPAGGAARRKILYYTDCFIFGGCENVVLGLFINPEISARYDVSFSYRNHASYRKVLDSRLPAGSPSHPLRILSNESLWHRIDQSGGSRFGKLLRKAPFALAKRSGLYAAFNFARLFFWFRTMRPDILHINNGGYPGADSCRVAVVSAVLAGVPRIVFHVHNQATPPVGIFDGPLDRFIGGHVDFFVSASQQATETLARNRPFDKGKIVQFYNFIREEQIARSRAQVLAAHGIPENCFVIVEVAFLTERKGQMRLLEALSMLKAKNPGGLPPIKLILIGDGEDRERLEAFAKKAGLEGDVVFAGFRNDSCDYLNAADLFALPSTKNEDMPLVVLDAMRLGKTIIASSVAGIAEEIRHGLDGWLVQPDNKEVLAAGLEKLVLDAGLRARYAQSAKQRYAETFSREIAIERFLKLYGQLVP